jgi:MIP family channel proteins
MNVSLSKKCVAEFIGTYALVFVAIGVIFNNVDHDPGLLGVALAQGLTIAVMVSATGAISGGHLNPAVSLGVFIGGTMNVRSLAAYWIAQLAGASAAAFTLVVLLGDSPQMGMGFVAIATPQPGPEVTFGRAIAIEAVLTFFLVFVVYGTMVDGRAPKVGGLFIGLTVALDILFGGPLTGAAMNPARTFGPALASGQWTNHLVYWIGPLAGGAAAGLVYGRFLIKPSNPA